jgi:hypothetical protein
MIINTIQNTRAGSSGVVSKMWNYLKNSLQKMIWGSEEGLSNRWWVLRGTKKWPYRYGDICTYIHTYIWPFSCGHTHMHTHMHASSWGGIKIRMIHTHTHACVNASSSRCIIKRRMIHTHIHAYTYTCMHTCMFLHEVVLKEEWYIHIRMHA